MKLSIKMKFIKDFGFIYEDGIVLPINKKDMLDRGWDELDFIIVSGDAYIDHPSLVCDYFRILEAFNYKVGTSLNLI